MITELAEQSQHALRSDPLCGWRPWLSCHSFKFGQGAMVETAVGWPASTKARRSFRNHPDNTTYSPGFVFVALEAEVSSLRIKNSWLMVPPSTASLFLPIAFTLLTRPMRPCLSFLVDDRHSPHPTRCAKSPTAPSPRLQRCFVVCRRRPSASGTMTPRKRSRCLPSSMTNLSSISTSL